MCGFCNSMIWEVGLSFRVVCGSSYSRTGPDGLQVQNIIDINKIIIS